jgi:translation initiation factor 2B subunit (eIF-2B alpha/beta/delta family)
MNREQMEEKYGRSYILLFEYIGYQLALLEVSKHHRDIKSGRDLSNIDKLERCKPVFMDAIKNYTVEENEEFIKYTRENIESLSEKSDYETAIILANSLLNSYDKKVNQFLYLTFNKYDKREEIKPINYDSKAEIKKAKQKRKEKALLVRRFRRSNY